jgi:hypothetical protein
MDPSFNGEWSASEIETVKSHIAGNNTNTYANNMNKKHTDIMDELQAIFPLKEKHQVTNLYVELMMEMMHRMQGGNQHVVTNNNIMIGNFGTPLEDPSMGNMEVLCDPLMEEMEAIRKGVEVPQRHPMPQKEKQHAVRFWTKEEHRLLTFFLSLNPLTYTSVLDPLIRFALFCKYVAYIFREL